VAPAPDDRRPAARALGIAARSRRSARRHVVTRDVGQPDRVGRRRRSNRPARRSKRSARRQARTPATRSRRRNSLPKLARPRKPDTTTCAT
jgi:hypothetical protein